MEGFGYMAKPLKKTGRHSHVSYFPFSVPYGGE